MKQLVILSGKGGTGKTSITASFAFLSANSQHPVSAVFVDADVDAANLNLLMQTHDSIVHEFHGGALAEIDADACTGCAACVAVCRYDALIKDSQNAQVYQVDPLACDGCAACVYACPVQAVTMQSQQDGVWMQSKTEAGTLFHAELFAGKENSGKLVTLIKQQAKRFANENQLPLVVIDGPPGIGCPVISACSGVDLGLIVAEPSLSGLHDLQRVLGTLQHFQVPVVICINKADIYPEGAAQIRAFANGQGIDVLGGIPYDVQVHQAVLAGKPVAALHPQSAAALAIGKIWDDLIARIL